MTADPRHAAISRLMENHRAWATREGSGAVVALTLSHLRHAAQVPPELLEAACERLVACWVYAEPPKPGHVRSELLRMGWVPGVAQGETALERLRRTFVAPTPEEVREIIARSNEGDTAFHRERRKRAQRSNDNA